jgi:hypothetical protein
MSLYLIEFLMVLWLLSYIYMSFVSLYIIIFFPSLKRSSIIEKYVGYG